MIYRHTGVIRVKIYLFLKHIMSTDSLSFDLVGDIVSCDNQPFSTKGA